ncbi:hypothetical protein CEH05_04555 [Halobacillus halophilus]|nr:hypothetical protein CEH05_04555 [Halobacillus halophilus]
MNMTGEAPEGASLRRLSARDVRLRSPRPVATSNDPASCRAAKSEPFPGAPLSTQYLEAEFSTIRRFSGIEVMGTIQKRLV